LGHLFWGDFLRKTWHYGTMAMSIQPKIGQFEGTTLEMLKMIYPLAIQQLAKKTS
jgi:hypothetical protein